MRSLRLFGSIGKDPSIMNLEWGYRREEGSFDCATRRAKVRHAGKNRVASLRMTHWRFWDLGGGPPRKAVPYDINTKREHPHIDMLERHWAGDLRSDGLGIVLWGGFGWGGAGDGFQSDYGEACGRCGIGAFEYAGGRFAGGHYQERCAGAIFLRQSGDWHWADVDSRQL